MPASTTQKRRTAELDEDSIRRELLPLELGSEDGLIEEGKRQVREEALLERLAMSQRGNAHPVRETVDG